MSAAAPSVKGEEVAAVTVPDCENTGFKRDIDSSVVSGRIQPSLLIDPDSESISMSSWSKNPSLEANDDFM